MATSPNLHLALYGNVAMLRDYCSECKSYAFVIDGKRQCCDSPVDVPEKGAKKIKRISEPEQKRHDLSPTKKKELLERYDYRCFYCCRQFGATVKVKGRARILRVQWDHVIPFAYSQNNGDNNYVPACQFCNMHKKDLIFDSLEQVQLYVQQKIERDKELS